MAQLFDRISSPDGLIELARFIEELNARVERLERSAADAVALYDAEAERQGRWWRTYDAAISGAVIAMLNGGDYDEVFVHEVSKNHANRAHGPLRKE